MIGALLVVAVATLLGYGVARADSRRNFLSEIALLVTFAVPSTVVGVGIINLWNRPGIPGGLYRSLAIIVVAYLARFTPVATLILAASVRQVPTSLEEAAELSGAGWLRRFTRIILPQLRSGVTAALLVTFIFAFGELGATVLVTPPGSSTLPVHIYTMIANAPPREVAALALMQMGIILIPLALFGIPGSWRRSR